MDNNESEQKNVFTCTGMQVNTECAKNNQMYLAKDTPIVSSQKDDSTSFDELCKIFIKDRDMAGWMLYCNSLGLSEECAEIVWKNLKKSGDSNE